MLGKTDVVFSRSMTIAPQQYENIKPSINITFKDVPIEKMSDLYSNATEFIENVYDLEIFYNLTTYRDIKKNGVDEYVKKIYNERINNILENLESSIDKISVEVYREDK